MHKIALKVKSLPSIIYSFENAHFFQLSSHKIRSSCGINYYVVSQSIRSYFQHAQYFDSIEMKSIFRKFGLNCFLAF